MENMETYDQTFGVILNSHKGIRPPLISVSMRSVFLCSVLFVVGCQQGTRLDRDGPQTLDNEVME